MKTFCFNWMMAELSTNEVDFVYHWQEVRAVTIPLRDAIAH